MGTAEIEAYLMWLVATGNVSSSTHRQALSALLFLYGKVLDVELPWWETIGRPREVKRLPVTLSPDEVTLRLGRFLSAQHFINASKRWVKQSAVRVV